MKTQISMSVEAKKDLIEILEWYREHGDDLDDKFLKKLYDCFEVIQKNPDSYGMTSKRTKVASLVDFPYGVYFQKHEQEVIVVAIQHASRSDRHWKRRLK